MTETVGVVVATYGDREYWDPLAERAVESVSRQIRTPNAVIRQHGSSLHEARNAGARLADTDWIIFLDADDELDDRYLEAMCAASGDVRQPATLGVVNGVEDDSPVVIPTRPLLESNYIVVGAMCRTEQFLRLGGFGNWPAFEDWALWLSFWIDGAVICPVPDAIYRVHVNGNSRNQMSPDAAGRAYRAIRNHYLPLAQQKGLA